MLALRIIISITAFLLGSAIAKKKERRPFLWGLLSLAFPAYPGYLLQTSPNEKIVKPLVIRSILAGLVVLTGSLFFSEPQFRGYFSGYEELIRNNVSTVLSAIGITHYLDGTVFSFPKINIEITKGSSHLYSAVLLFILSGSISLFFRTKNLIFLASYTLAFTLIGHFITVAITVSTFLSIQDPNDITKDFFEYYRTIYWITGASLVYLSFYFLVWRKSKTNCQNKSVLTTSEPAPPMS